MIGKLITLTKSMNVLKMLTTAFIKYFIKYIVYHLLFISLRSSPENHLISLLLALYNYIHFPCFILLNHGYFYNNRYSMIHPVLLRMMYTKYYILRRVLPINSTLAGIYSVMHYHCCSIVRLFSYPIRE